ncbi:hypothetical protein DFH09DRAFT_1366185 [Mycena vulgaris]|nr:hypothetical protein DFH09DRAFT_1366185 [Mycena vulgaris]
MPKANHTIDDLSPLIGYSLGWRPGGIDDSLISSYSNGTFTLCDTQGSYASFTFNGTAIWVYGAKRPNHGQYSVALDNNITVHDGFASDSILQTPLFVATNLADTTHSITITNQGTNASLAFLDLDFITWTSSIGKSGETITFDTVEDTSSAFSYKPAAAWVQNTTNLSGFSSNTGHSTFSKASAVYTFIGDEVTLYGAVGPNLAPYTVSLDNGTATSYNATKSNYTAQVPLYHASGLGSGVHTIEVTNDPESFGQALSIDYAITANVPSISTSSTSASTSSKVRLGPGAIAGIVVGVVAILAALILSLFFWRRRSRKCGDREKSAFEIDGSTTPTPFLIAAEHPSPSAVGEQTAVSVGRSGPASDSEYGSVGQMSGLAAPTTVSTLLNPWSARDSRDTSAVDVSGFASERGKRGPSFLSTSTPVEEIREAKSGGGNSQNFAESPPDYQEATQSIH